MEMYGIKPLLDPGRDSAVINMVNVMHTTCVRTVHAARVYP